MKQKLVYPKKTNPGSASIVIYSLGGFEFDFQWGWSCGSETKGLGIRITDRYKNGGKDWSGSMVLRRSDAKRLADLIYEGLASTNKGLGGVGVVAIDEPFWGSAKCSECGREWTTMLLDGCENSNELECPSCGEPKGEIMGQSVEDMIRELRNKIAKMEDPAYDKRAKAIINTKLEEAELYATRLEGYPQ